MMDSYEGWNMAPDTIKLSGFMSSETHSSARFVRNSVPKARSHLSVAVALFSTLKWRSDRTIISAIYNCTFITVLYLCILDCTWWFGKICTWCDFGIKTDMPTYYLMPRKFHMACIYMSNKRYYCKITLLCYISNTNTHYLISTVYCNR